MTVDNMPIKFHFSGGCLAHFWLFYLDTSNHWNWAYSCL